MLRRGVDIAVGTTLLALLAPALFVIAVLIRIWGGPGPVFDRREQVGLQRGRFLAWRFRCTPHEAAADEGWPAANQSPRVNLIGATLSHHNLDRLPGLVNVALGELSLSEFLAQE
jgi:lipopolysaccharide/colanic/teichoic acid biosynthesis glycosyltransferase